MHPTAKARGLYGLLGKILYLEEVNMGSTVLLYAEEALAQSQQIGLFDEISGLIVGKMNNLSQNSDKKGEKSPKHYRLCGGCRFKNG